MDERRIDRAEKEMRFAVGGIGLMAVLAFLIGILLLWPYSPMTVYSYEAEVSEACAGVPVTAYIEYEIREGARVSRLEVEPDWIAVDVPGVAEGFVSVGGEGVIPGEGLETGYPARVRSSVLRVAPLQPGEWLVGGELTLRTSVYGLPRVQVLSPTAKEPITVLPADDPKCEKKGST